MADSARCARIVQCCAERGHVRRSLSINRVKPGVDAHLLILQVSDGLVQGSQATHADSDSDAAVEHAAVQDLALVVVKVKDRQAVRAMPPARDVAVVRDGEPLTDLASDTTRALALGCKFDRLVHSQTNRTRPPSIPEVRP